MDLVEEANEEGRRVDFGAGRLLGGLAVVALPAGRAAARARVVAERALERDLGRKRVIQRRFNVSVPLARVPEKTHRPFERPFREMIARRNISRNEWKTTERGAV